MRRLEARRYRLRTDRIIPSWFVLLWDVACASLAAIVVIVVVIAARTTENVLVSLGFVVWMALMVGGLHIIRKRLSDPERNYVQLSSSGIEIHVYGTGGKTVHLDNVEDVTEEARHGLGPLGGYWPPMATTEVHVDVRLRRMIRVYFGWGRLLPFAKVLHFDVDERERFVADLRELLAARGSATGAHA